VSAHTAGGAGRIRPGRGRGAARPDGLYEPAPEVRSRPEGVEVRFVGDDDRERVYSFATLPLPGLHREFAGALEERIGSAVGSRRTLASANCVWQAVSRFVVWLASLPRPPATIAGLRASHFERFLRHRMVTTKEVYAVRDFKEVLLFVGSIPSRDRLEPRLSALLDRRGNARGATPAPGSGPPGYSEREREALMRAAREDVVTIRRRIREGTALARRALEDPRSVPEGDRVLAEMLAGVVRTGRVPHLGERDRPRGTAEGIRSRRGVASRLFLTVRDLAPLLVFGALVSGRNGETLKELPVEHRVLEGRVVVLTVIKRRRGKVRTFETVHWESGPRGDDLKTPGGFYLLMHELCSLGREFSRSPHVWSVWAAGGAKGKDTTGGHVSPFAESLGRGIDLGEWAARKDLVGDDGRPLKVTLGRLKKTEDIRRTRAVGGHLPSAVMTNGIETLFRDYLVGDPSVREWAEDVLGEALRDAEESARAFFPQVLDEAAERAARTNPEGAARALATTGSRVRRALDGDLDTAVASCLDFEHHPQTGCRCTASFLTCLLCRNALVLERHLPALLTLVDELQSALDTMDAATWCRRNGVIWLVLTRHVLPRFSPAQHRDAIAAGPGTDVLAAFDGLKEPR
jgi:hypothetical protein